MTKHLLPTENFLNNKTTKMKKIITSIIVLLFINTTMKACDICGCGVGNNYIGILPDFNKHIFGLRYRYNFLRTHIGVGGATTYLTTQENYKTVELWGGWNIGKHFRLMASVPYNFNKRATSTATAKKNGIGDITISGYYQLINSRKNVASKLLVQSLWLGGGIKLPTGKYEIADKSMNNQNANLFQLGTASTDFSLNAMYDVRLNDGGINLAAAYKMNTTNKHDYQYGNKFSLNTQAYYKFRIKNKVMIAPNAGVQYETARHDKDNGFNVTISGGNLFVATAGLELAFKDFGVGMNVQTPLSENLAAGFVKAANRGMAHISYSF